MGMSAPVLAAIISASGAAASGIGSALAQPSNQERESFRNTAYDPRNTGPEANNLIRSAIGDAMVRANAPIDLPNATVSQPPTMTGGGLPMPIGLTGKVPVRLTPGNTVRTPGGPSDPYGDRVPGHVPPPSVPGRTGPIDPQPPPSPVPPPGSGPETPIGPQPDPTAPGETPPPSGGPVRRPLPTSPNPNPNPNTGTSFLARDTPRRLGLMGGGGGVGETPTFNGAQVSPQAIGAVQLLLHSLTGMQGAAGGRG